MSGTKVYLVTQGEYSSYHVDSVWATEEEAAVRVKELKADASNWGSDSTEVEPYWVGRIVRQPKWSVFLADAYNWHPSTGTTAYSPARADVTQWDDIGRAEPTRDEFNPPRPEGERFGWPVFHGTAYVSAPDEVTAIKIASERFAQWKARQ